MRKYIQITAAITLILGETVFSIKPGYGDNCRNLGDFCFVKGGQTYSMNPEMLKKACVDIFNQCVVIVGSADTHVSKDLCNKIKQKCGDKLECELFTQKCSGE
ncbi:MAG: hypothetical protein KBD90_04405 [Alphaproteobacteria bacterium]|nr:hypothetical protein [Alphaproteobacteria bacterium]